MREEYGYQAGPKALGGPVKVRQSELSDGIDRLMARSNTIGERVANIRKRLYPVLRTVSENPNKTAGSDCVEQTEVGRQIRTITDLLDAINLDLIYIEDNLEV